MTYPEYSQDLSRVYSYSLSIIDMERIDRDFARAMMTYQEYSQDLSRVCSYS